MEEAIILAGGEGWRLKPETLTPKPLLKINKETLLDKQILWLQARGFRNIVVASDRDGLTTLDVEYSVETNKLGTGGATKKAFQRIKGDIFSEISIALLNFFSVSPIYLLYNLDGLAGKTDGFSGAEIELIVVSALYSAFSDNVNLTQEYLNHEINHTRPLSKIRFEQIDALRVWAKERTIGAN